MCVIGCVGATFTAPARRGESRFRLPGHVDAARAVQCERESARVVVAVRPGAATALPLHAGDTQVRRVQHGLTGRLELRHVRCDASGGHARRRERRARRRGQTIGGAAGDVDVAGAVQRDRADAAHRGVERGGQPRGHARAADAIDVLVPGRRLVGPAGDRIRERSVVGDEVGVADTVARKTGDDVTRVARGAEGRGRRRPHDGDERGLRAGCVDARHETLSVSAIRDLRGWNARERGRPDDAGHVRVAFLVQHEIAAGGLQVAGERSPRGDEEHRIPGAPPQSRRRPGRRPAVRRQCAIPQCHPIPCTIVTPGVRSPPERVGSERWNGRRRRCDPTSAQRRLDVRRGASVLRETIRATPRRTPVRTDRLRPMRTPFSA